jgi:hypothetical protein
MAKRGKNTFKLNDGRRALRIARDSGLEPAVMEIVAKDGTVFRIYGPETSPQADAAQETTGGGRELQDAIANPTKPRQRRP